ncbi:MAG: amino acid transporter [SAR86 cluster bacterium]|uniref:Amino acid transporter n=1 Tax=SAR86 cluster bacterium TaxID=2030880 RepID=A0A2A5AP25_9GAMM|nr:MAG: amino acid transporter [SAR86 cluster bacterium]
MTVAEKNEVSGQLVRSMGLWGLTATGICSMLGASVYVVPFMIQRNVPGIGDNVLPAFLFAAVPALFAAFAYAMLASAMPRAGGSYIYASRGLNPYLGFIASFSQWFGLSIVIGVIAYIIVPFIRDVAIALEWQGVAELLEQGMVRVGIALALIWGFVFINIRGTQIYQRTLIPLMILMFALGSIVVVAGLNFNHADFALALAESEGRIAPAADSIPLDWRVFLSASALLFSSFIGFDSIAQAGGEAKNPGKALPMAIGLAICIVGSFYFLVTYAVYHAVPWTFIAQEAMERDISAPGMLAYLLPTSFSVAILSGAAIALINDLPAMLLSVSRLMFAWAEDGIFPSRIAKIHQQHHTPHVALIVSGIIASLGVFGSHFAGDIFLGIDIMVTAMMVNFLLMCATLISLPKVNPVLASKVTLLKNKSLQLLIGWLGVIFLSAFLLAQLWKDITSEVTNWYFHSTWVWLIVMAIGTAIFFSKTYAMKKAGINTNNLFSTLPGE